MPDESLRVVATITALPGKAAEMKAILEKLIAPTRAEAGCISYEVLQNNHDPNDFVFVEEWTSDAALDQHMVTPHLQDAVEQVGSMLAKPPDIRRYSLVG
jgi:quinol monooxygenase YgiN